MSVRPPLAEDTDHVRKKLVDMLGFRGCKIVGEAEDGETAVRGMEGTDPGVVVMAVA
jgi:DNA-binding NarL/FixJ family response regulator